VDDYLCSTQFVSCRVVTVLVALSPIYLVVVVIFSKTNIRYVLRLIVTRI